MFSRDNTDYLGMAAAAERKAVAATKAGDFDEAWRCYHEQKEHYGKHAHRSEFTPQQAVALDGSVHKGIANVLRIEGRHMDAFVHFLYYYATSPRLTKSDEKQIVAYFNRAMIESVDFDQVSEFIKEIGTMPDFRSIQNMCAEWKNPSKPS